MLAARRGMGGKGGCWLLVVLMALPMPGLLSSMSIFMVVLRVSLGPTRSRLGTCGFGGGSCRDGLARVNAGIELYSKPGSA